MEKSKNAKMKKYNQYSLRKMFTTLHKLHTLQK